MINADTSAARFSHNKLFRYVLRSRGKTRCIDRCAPSEGVARADAARLVSAAGDFAGFTVVSVEQIASFVAVAS